MSVNEPTDPNEQRPQAPVTVADNWTEELSDECRADWAAVREENARRDLPDADRTGDELEGFTL